MGCPCGAAWQIVEGNKLKCPKCGRIKTVDRPHVKKIEGKVE